jgi:GntR family transcriptional regulator
MARRRYRTCHTDQATVSASLVFWIGLPASASGRSKLDNRLGTCTILVEQEDKSVFEVDHKDPTPIYAQLERSIRIAIATGGLEVGDQLPTVRQMAVALCINANTVAKVYGALEKAGVLETQRGVGTFVASSRDLDGRPLERERQLTSLLDRFLIQAAELGFDAEQVLESLQMRARSGVDDNAKRQRKQGNK